MAFYTAPEYQQANVDDIQAYLKIRKIPANTLNINAARLAINRARQQEALPKGREVKFTANNQSRQICYGYSRVPGTVVFIEAEEDYSEIHLVIAVAGHEIESIQEMYFDDARVDFPSVPGASSAIVPKSGASIFTDSVYLEKRLGEDAQAALTYIVSQVPLAWTSTHAMLGIACVGVSLTWDSNLYASGFPDFSFLIHGKKVYDPRTDTTYFSNNAALCLADYLTDTRYGLGYSWDKIDTDSLESAANVCGESVTLASGSTEIRYAIDGYFLASESPREILEQFAQAMAGQVYYAQGKWKFLPGTARTLTFDFTSDDIISPISIDSNAKKSEIINTVTGTFNDPSNDYVETGFPTVKNSTYIANDGEVLELDLELKFTASSARAQRIAKIFLEYSRQGLKVSFIAKLRALSLEIGDFVTLTLPKYGWEEKEFEVLELELLEEGSAPGNALVVSVILKEVAAEIYDWANGEETTFDLAPNTNLPSAFSSPSLSGLALDSGTDHLLLTGDGTILSRIYLTWANGGNAFITSGGRIEVQYKISSDSDWIEAGFLNGSLTNYYITNVQDGEMYDVRVRAVNALGAAGSWDTVLNYTVIGKTELPSDISSFSYSIQDFNVVFDWDEIGDTDRSFYEIRQGSDWDSAIVVYKGRVNTYTLNAQTAGAYTFLIKAIDTSGNYSENATSVSFTVTAPSISSITPTFSGQNLLLKWVSLKGSYSIDEFVVSYGPTYASSIELAQVYTNSFSLKASWLADRIFWITPIDIAGNSGSPLSTTATISRPDRIPTISNEVVDNNVLLRWSAPGSSTLPIATYNIYKGDTFATAAFQGSSDTTFKALFELAAGTFVYWIVAVDTAGNFGVETSTTAQVSSPPDFELILNQALIAENADTLTNIAFEGQFLRTVDGGFFDLNDEFL